MPAVSTTSSPGSSDVTSAWCPRTRRCCGRMKITHSRTNVAARTSRAPIDSLTSLMLRVGPLAIAGRRRAPDRRDLDPQGVERAAGDRGTDAIDERQGPGDVVQREQT